MSTKPRRKPRNRKPAPRMATARPGARIAIVRGQDASRFTDFYHAILKIPWSAFLFGLALFFVGINSAFALLYLVELHGIANARPGSFWDAFDFSVQTMGSMSNSAMTARSGYARGVVVAETFIGIIYLGLVTSLMYARFSRPFARVVFSKIAVIAPFDGVPTLMFRAANQRGNSILDAEAKVTLARRQVTEEGIAMRRFEELKLARDRSSLFALSWTVMHAIDKSSPLYGLDVEGMMAAEMEVVVLLSGTDDTLAERIYARNSYTPADIRWDHRFVDVLSVSDSGRRVVDLTRFHDTEPVETG
ncbi:MAG: ATP-sensitive inward rectifier potassium channel 10 [Alphaproteobacteria bacterium]|nr:ATP-sensitive inward rectifier potassium channel 10 [Alphaproteobacteria bacterium]